VISRGRCRGETPPGLEGLLPELGGGGLADIVQQQGKRISLAAALNELKKGQAVKIENIEGVSAEYLLENDE
jgi:hypothetical protein